MLSLSSFRCRLVNFHHYFSYTAPITAHGASCAVSINKSIGDLSQGFADQTVLTSAGAGRYGKRPSLRP